VEQPSSRAAGTADKLMTVDEKWLHKNKDHGMMSAAASLGLILLWDVDEGLSQVRLEPFRRGCLAWLSLRPLQLRLQLSAALGCAAEQIDKYLYSTQEYIKAGALLAVGIVNRRASARRLTPPALRCANGCADRPAAVCSTDAQSPQRGGCTVSL
jgi:26S proteasome regulatory subunit N1